MKVFITGGSGFVGSHIIKQLVPAGHIVTALARSNKSAEYLISLGATPILGNLTDLDVIRQAASEADATIHCAFDLNQAGGIEKAIQEDRATIQTMLDALVGTGKTLINSSGTLAQVGAEETALKAPGPLGARGVTEELVISYAKRGVRGVNVRLSAVVHGPGQDHVFIYGLINAAKRDGYVGYLEGDSSVWPAVYVEDAAKLYVLALTAEKLKGGVNLHAATEEGIPTKEIAEFIGKKMGLEVKAATAENALEEFGFTGLALQFGGRVSTKLTREWTDWLPNGPDLFSTIETYKY